MNALTPIQQCRPNRRPADDQASRDLVLAELEHVSACLRFVQAEVDMIGKQLSAGAITVEQAQWMVNNLTDPVGLLDRALLRGKAA